MPKTEEYQLRPLGWENDPEEERLRFSSLDYLAASSYNSYAIFFKVGEEERPKIVAVLKEGLERTLAQCRQLVGTIEKNSDNDDHSFVKKRDTVVKFIVKYFDADDNVPSLADIEKAHYATSCLGDTSRFVVDGMAYGEKPECHPSAKPVISAFQANFIPGGLIFLMNFHHYANDVMGWANLVHQLAENCASIVNNTPPPPWDPSNLDPPRFTATDFPSASKVDGPTPPDRNPLLRTHSSLLFHLPKPAAAALKALASTPDGPWISTYDGIAAFLVRTLTLHRAPLYSAPATDTPFFLEAINMRRRTNPLVAPRQQRNLFWAAASAHYPNPLTIAEISAPEAESLPRLAARSRTMTDSIDQAALDAALGMLAPVRDKTCLFTRVNSFPPLSVAITDWREAAVCETDFGFAGPTAFRHLFDAAVTEGLVLIYPPRRSEDENEGCEFVVTVENEIVDAVSEELGRFFELRGWEVDARGN